MLLVFVVEATKEAVAQTLLDLAKTETPPKEARLALAEGKLFCLLVATSPMVGGKTVETPESLRRLSAPIAEVLARTVRERR